MNDSVLSLEVALQQFEEIRISLDVKKSLQWELSLNGLKSALHFIENPQTQQFVEDYMLKQVSLMTSQNPGKLGIFERNTIDQSLEICLQILCFLLPSRPKLLSVLGKIFDPHLIYYNGNKIGYSYSPGFPHMRIVNGKKFADMRGFTLIHQVFQSEFWPGCEVLRPLVKLMDSPEVSALIDEHLRVEIARTVMAKLLTLSDEVAKKENTDILQEVIRLLANVWTSAIPKNASPLAIHQHMTVFHKFWMGYISKLIRSSSLVLKLFGWEQVNDLILEAKNKRADAASFQVMGAGTTVVNGIYHLNGKHGDTNSNRYVKQPSTPDEPFLTLFRCTMRTKAKWWFISVADLEKPGTDKDVDYYLHRSNPEDEREPPPFNWVHLNQGITLVGIDPCPVVRRHDIVIPHGMSRDMFLDAEVIAWCTKGDLLTEIFGHSIHREIINRSGKLLIFLAEYDILDAKYLSLIWKSVLTNHDNDIVDEILCQLVHLSPYLSSDLFAFLINLANEELSRGEEQQVAKVAQFMEKFAKEGSKNISSGVLTPDAVSVVANWLWTLFCRPNFEQIKCSGAIQELLSICLHRKGSSFSVVREKVLECKTKLAMPSEQHHNRLVNILYFLISKHCTFELAEQLTKEGLSGCILAEIRRHVLENRAGGGADYIVQLASRLNLFRRFVALTSQLSLENVEVLWQLLKGHPQELDELFHFLKIGSTGTSHDNICSPEVAVQIFGNYVCNPQVDWSSCGTAALDCFHAYFSQIETHSEQVASMFSLPPTGGLDTLWRIVLSIHSVDLGSNAIDWLILAYDRQYNRGVTSACSDLLQRVFTHLTEVQAQFEESDNRALSSKSLLCIRRCVRVLHCAILRWKGVGGPSHIVRNCLSRINITILYRRVSPYYNHSVHSDVMRVDKGFEGSVTVEVHPFFTILQLKERIVRAVSIINDVSGINFDSTNHVIINDFTRVFELGVLDGGMLHCSYQSMYTNKGYELNDSVTNDYTEPNTPSSSSVGSCVGQLLADNYSLFDCLLSLCELLKNPDDCKAVWEVLMLAPTQMDLYQQTKDQICVPSPMDGSSGSGSKTISNTWNADLESCPSVARKAYLLQIIDSFLQPAPELSTVDSLEQSLAFKDAFISSDGFDAVLRILISTPTSDLVTNSTALAVALHIIHFLLFGDSAAPMVAALMDIDMDDSIDEGMAKLAIETSSTSCYNAKQTEELLHQIERVSDQVIEKLLLIARYAADREESSVVQNALLIITNLIKAPEVASQLINNGESKTLLCLVLRSGSKRVREMAADFAIQVGKSQPVVFSWLVNELLNISAKDNVSCSETFLAISDLLPETHIIIDSDVTLLAEIISEKLLAFTTTQESELVDEPNVLLGYLELLNTMMKRHTGPMLETLLGQDLIPVFMKQFLFALPSSSLGGESTAATVSTAICVSPQSRVAAFNVLASYVCLFPAAFEEVMEELSALSEKAAGHFTHIWSAQIAHEVRQRDLKFTGLKNQGCTCYMNSLLQLLFMSTTFREAILATPLPESIRSTVWHRSPQELVGQEIYFAWSSGSWRLGKIVDYIEEENLHTVEYYHSDGTLDESATFNIHEGRFSRETGKVRLISNSNEEPLNDRDDAAYRVLEQLQRTFCFLKLSNRRYFDPRPFVEACKTLNLNFNVYSQNDAAEFCDQLLDRVETATKGKHSKIDLWTDELMRNVFGGKWLYQKIPRECEAYETNKSECGHYQGSRLESFLKVELMIRGKERIDESLEELVQGELMDGDNKISCDVCGEKKATVRRTCFGVLPNTLILHLKRFDLDFQTFETVKLNNKLSFPTKINLLKYTKEGIEAADKAQQDSQEQQNQQQSQSENKNEDSTLSDENSPDVVDEDGNSGNSEKKQLILEYEHSIDPSGDFEYELQGVLVHAGVAQGGHYYSFVRDETNPSEETSWYRFDDDVVSSFNPENIPTQCFGGPQPSMSTNHMHSLIDEDRSTNALMLLYNKVKRVPTALTPTHTSTTAANVSAVGSALVTGTQAFEREVQESNLQHTLSVYLIDPALHSFVRGMLDAIAPQKSTASGVSDDVVTHFELVWPVEEADFELPLRLVQFYSEYLLNVVLHCRERTAMRSSVSVLIAVFEKFPDTALWFVSHVLGEDCNWFHDYLILCTDALARASFVQLLVQAVIVFAPKEPNALRKLLQHPTSEIRSLPNQNSVSLCALLVRSLMELVLKSVNHIRTADEIFVAIRDLSAAVPCICNALQSAGCVSYLSFFVLPSDQVPVHVRTAFERYLIHTKQSTTARGEYSHVMQSVFEAMAALLGVPQIRKVNLLQDRSYFVPELILEAKEALTIIFVESSHNGYMDTTDAHAYFDKVNGINGKMTGQQLRHFMDRYSSSLDGKLNLEGFLQYHTDNASLNPKLVWRDLHAFGFKNNLVRMVAASQQHRAQHHPEHHADDSFVSADSRVDSVTDGSVAGGAAVDDSFVSTQPTGQLHITEYCKESLSKIALYESGMTASEASTKAIAMRCCTHSEAVSVDLLIQALQRLRSTSLDQSWHYQHGSMVFDFIKMLIGINDELVIKRIHTVLLNPEVGLASVVQQERLNLSKCRSNEFVKYALFDKYIGYVQDLIVIPGVLDCINSLAASEPTAKFVRGFLKLHLHLHNLSENELANVQNTIVVVDGAGTREVNGEYRFVDVKNQGGYYERLGPYNGNNTTRFTLYKCHLKNGGYQWFISITPDDVDPGTVQDMDFYYAAAKLNDRTPPAGWMTMTTQCTKDPAPRVECLCENKTETSESSEKEEEEDEEDLCSSLAAGDDDIVDTSFISNGSDLRDFYD